MGQHRRTTTRYRLDANADACSPNRAGARNLRPTTCALTLACEGTRAYARALRSAPNSSDPATTRPDMGKRRYRLGAEVGACSPDCAAARTGQPELFNVNSTTKRQHMGQWSRSKARR